ncbi:porin [Phaeospirillum tilakii]|uniref:Porin n=1 Tax=Phaeospirillum tilakii TaxID=741673 RepID=A0ABW5CCX1_9PROT
MKNRLLVGTALVAGCLGGLGPAEAADPIKINVGGFSKWWVVGASQSGAYSKALGYTGQGGYSSGASGAYNTAGIKGDNEIWFQGSTALDNGLKVGVFVSLEAGGHTDETTDPIDHSYAWVEGGFGKLMLGTLKNAAYQLHVQAPDAAANWNDGGMATAGFAVARPAAVEGMNEREGYTGVWQTTSIIADNKAEKIVYFTPTFAGVTLGATYVPDATTEDNRGQGKNRGQAYGLGAGYATSLGPVGVKLSAGAFQTELAAGERVNQYSGGSQLSYAGFTLGGSYQLARDQIAKAGNVSTTSTGANGSVGNNPVGTAAATAIGRALGVGNGVNYRYDFGGEAYDVGLQYASGPYAISFAYFHSATRGVKLDSYGIGKHDDDTIDVYQASGKYALSPGIDLLASVGYADFESGLYKLSSNGYRDTLKNDGYFGMTGLSLKF